MSAPLPKLPRFMPIAALGLCALLSACSNPNDALNERVAKAEAAAQRAEAAAAKAEKALAGLEKPKEAPTMIDGGPQLTPEPSPDPMVPSAQDQGPAEPQAPAQ